MEEENKARKKIADENKKKSAADDNNSAIMVSSSKNEDAASAAPKNQVPVAPIQATPTTPTPTTTPHTNKETPLEDTCCTSNYWNSSVEKTQQQQQVILQAAGKAGAQARASTTTTTTTNTNTTCTAPSSSPKRQDNSSSKEQAAKTSTTDSVNKTETATTSTATATAATPRTTSSTPWITDGRMIDPLLDVQPLPSSLGSITLLANHTFQGAPTVFYASIRESISHPGAFMIPGRTNYGQHGHPGHGQQQGQHGQQQLQSSTTSSIGNNHTVGVGDNNDPIMASSTQLLIPIAAKVVLDNDIDMEEEIQRRVVQGIQETLAQDTPVAEVLRASANNSTNSASTRTSRVLFHSVPSPPGGEMSSGGDAVRVGPTGDGSDPYHHHDDDHGSRRELNDTSQEVKQQSWRRWSVPLVSLVGVVVVAVAVAVISAVVVVLLSTATNNSINESSSLSDRTSVHSTGPSQNWPSDDTVIAYVPDLLCLERIPLFGHSDHPNCTIIIGVDNMNMNMKEQQGSGVTNLIAASRLWRFPEVDISITNAGEARSDIDPGNFTVADTKELLTWTNSLVILKMEGSKLITALERALQKLVDDFNLLAGNETIISGGAYPYGAGIRYDVNMSQPFPNRLSKIEVNEGLASSNGWSPISRTKVYSIVTNSYMASGGDSYHEFNRVPAELVNETNIDTKSAFIAYCQATKILLDPPREQYSTQSYTNTLYDWGA